MAIWNEMKKKIIIKIHISKILNKKPKQRQTNKHTVYGNITLFGGKVTRQGSSSSSSGTLESGGGAWGEVGCYRHPSAPPVCGAGRRVGG